MQIVININERLVTRLGLALAAGGLGLLLVVPHLAQAGQLTVPNSFSSGSVISAGAMNDNFAAVRAEVNDNDTRISALEAILAGVTRPDPGTIRFSGMNVQIVNGSDDSTSANGSGNLILGYNGSGGQAGVPSRTGSHNLVIGEGHAYTGTLGLVAGLRNSIGGRDALILGGADNSAAGVSVVVGGQGNSTAPATGGGAPANSVVVGGVSGSVSSADAVSLGVGSSAVNVGP